MPTYTAIATGNVSYVKINKDNYSVSLQELTNLRIKFSDFGIVDFPILTISEYPTYYLYQIAPPVDFGGYINRFKSPTNPNTSAGIYSLPSNTSSPVFYGYTDTTGSIGSNGFYSFRDSYLPVAVSCSFAVTKNNTQTNKTFSIIFTSSLGVVREQSFLLPASAASYLYSTSFSYTPTSSGAYIPATLGIAFASSSLSIDLDISLVSIDLNINQYKLRSIDNNILNYYTSASNSSNQSGSTLNYNSVTGNTLNYLNTSSGIYTAGDTPNVPVIISASAVLNSTTGTNDTQIILYNINQNGSLGSPVPGFSSTSINISPGGNGTVYLSGSFIPIENSKYTVAISDDSPSPADITASYASFLVTQSVSPYTSSNLTVLEPFLESKFTNSDCDVLMNNAVNFESNELFMKVNYNTGQFIPTNQEKILNYTAEKAGVKPYNYSLLSQILPRYNGVRVTQQEENKWTEGDINSYGKSPSVQSLNNYIAYFEWIGGTTPELIGKASAYIKYLIDKDGNTTVPSLSSPYYYNLIDNFETNKNVILSLNTTEDSNVYKDVGPVPIIRAGALPMPILASQTGSNPTVISPLRFITSSLTIPDYTNFFYTGSGVSPNVTPNSTIVLPLNIENTFKPTITLSSNIIEINTTSNNTYLRLLLWDGTFINQLTGGTTANFSINFQKLVGPTWTNMGTYTETSVLAGNPQLATPGLANSSLFDVYGGGLSTLPFIPQSGDHYRVVITNLSPIATLQAIDYSVYLLQNPSYTGILFPATPYFTTGSNSKNILTGSDFNVLYNPSSPSTQQALTGSGYFSFLPFVINLGDQIRFEGDENQAYNIIKAVQVSPNNVNFHIILDRNIVDGTDLNSFLIRRLDPNPNFVTLDYDTSVNSVGKGFMIPEYATNELQQNYNKIIEKLKTDGLI